MVKVAVVYCGQKGHTEILSGCVAEGAKVAGAEVSIVNVTDSNQKPESLNEVDAIIFGCPTYFGSVPAEMKAFMDSSADIWVNQSWHNKVAGAFTNASSHSGDQLNVQIQLAIFAAQHGMIWAGLDLMPSDMEGKATEGDTNRIGSWLGAMAKSSPRSSNGNTPTEGDKKTAEHLGKRITEIAKRMKG